MAVTIRCGFNFKSQNVSANTSSYTFWVDAVCTSGSFNQTGGAICTRTFSGNLTGTQSKNVKFGTQGSTTTVTNRIWSEDVTITHNSDGSAQLTASVSLATGVPSSGTVYGSADANPSKLGRASTISSVSGTTFGSLIVISISKSNSSFTHTIKWQFGSGSGTIVTKTTSSSVTWNPSLSTMATYLTDNYYANCRLTCETYNGNTLVGTSTKDFTAGFSPSLVPSITSVTLTDPNDYYDTYDAFLTSKSGLNVSVSASGIHGSTIKSVQVTFNGVTKSGTSVPFSTSFGVLSLIGTYTMTIRVTDTRGRSASTTKSVIWTNRQPPSLTGTYFKRWTSGSTTGEESSEGTYIRVHYQGKINNGESGSGTVKIAYGLATGTQMTELSGISVGTTFSGDRFISNVSPESRYFVQVTVTDEMGISVVYSGYVNTVEAIMDFRYNGKGVAIGKVSEQDAFEVALFSDFQAEANFQEQALFGKKVVVSGDLSVAQTSTAKILGALVVSKTATFNDDVTVASSGKTTLNGQVSVGGTSTFASTATFNGQLKANSTVTATGNIAANGGVTLGSGQYLKSGTSNILRLSGSSLYFYLPSSGFAGDIGKTLWTGTWNGGDITAPGASKYNVFIMCTNSSTDESIVCVRSAGGSRLDAFGASSPAESEFYINGCSFTISGDTITRLRPRAMGVKNTSVQSTTIITYIYKVVGVI